MIAATGAGSALAGLVLVFLGVLVTTYGQLPGETPDVVFDRVKNAAVVTLVVFALSLVSVVLDVAWLAVGGGHRFYVLALATFFVQLAAVGVVGAWTTTRVLLR